jgi:DNA-binding LacI/PurR family transcriptional regulator/biotin operon repressor
MARINTTTIPEQAAAHLREGITSGRWVGEMPGRDQLAKDLGVSPRSIQKSLKILECEGLLVSQGKGRNNRIQDLAKIPSVKPMRVAVLLFKQADRNDPLVIELRHQLDDAGHVSILPNIGLQDLGMDVKRVERLVMKTKADAWVVPAASRLILQWFVEHDIKVFAIAGRRFELPIAGTGPGKAAIYAEVVQRLADLGHKRIVLLCGRQLRKPNPSKFSRAFLDGMKEAGLAVGDYNLPDWDTSPEGFQKILNSLFKATPPTALLLDEIHLFHAAYHFLAQRQLRVPQDVSLVCTDGNDGFAWCRPSVAHIAWDHKPVVRRIISWVNNIARGIDDSRQSFTKAKFIDGGTIGPAPER